VTLSGVFWGWKKSLHADLDRCLSFFSPFPSLVFWKIGCFLFFRRKLFSDQEEKLSFSLKFLISSFFQAGFAVFDVADMTTLFYCFILTSFSPFQASQQNQTDHAPPATLPFTGSIN